MEHEIFTETVSDRFMPKIDPWDLGRLLWPHGPPPVTNPAAVVRLQVAFADVKVRAAGPERPNAIKLTKDGKKLDKFLQIQMAST